MGFVGVLISVDILVGVIRGITWVNSAQNLHFVIGLGVDFVSSINAYALEKYLPDVTIFIDLSPEAAFKRKHGADENDRLEQAGMAFHQRVYEGFKALAAANPQRYVCVDGNKTPSEIFAEVLSVLKERNCL